MSGANEERGVDGASNSRDEASLSEPIANAHTDTSTRPQSARTLEQRLGNEDFARRGWQRLVELADRHTIIERGRVAWQGTSAALDADRDLWHRYLGV